MMTIAILIITTWRDGIGWRNEDLRSGKQPLKRRPVPLVASPPPLSPSCEALLGLWDFFSLVFALNPDLVIVFLVDYPLRSHL